MDNILTNKYFCVAILVALGVVIFMYSRKGSCEAEPMRSVNFAPIETGMTSIPWTNRPGASDLGAVGTLFDKTADALAIKKLESEKYKVYKPLPRSDQRFAMSVSDSDTDTDSDMDTSTPQPRRRTHRTRRSSGKKYNYPMPMDSRPDLSQCHPCNCERNDAQASRISASS